MSEFLEDIVACAAKAVIRRLRRHTESSQRREQTRHTPTSVSGEVWNVYSAYLSIGELDLEAVAKQLVLSRLARLSCLPDGTLLWLHEGRLRTDILEEKDDIHVERTEMRAPTDLREDLFYDAYWMARQRSSHRQLFREHGTFPVPHLRASLHPLCLRQKGGLEIDFDLSILIYEDGMTLVRFRCSTGEAQVETERFIEDLVGSRLRGIESSLVDPDLASIMMKGISCENKPRFRDRLKALWFRLRLPRALRTFNTSGERLVLPGDARSTLSSIGIELVKTIAYVLRSRRDSVTNVLFGREHVRWTGFWEGSLHVHVLAFTDQVASAARNHERNEFLIKNIITDRAPAERPLSSVEYGALPRSFDDFSVYAAIGRMVWLYGSACEGRAAIVHHNETLAEPLAYGSILLRSLLGEVQSPKPNWDRILDIRERWLTFEHRVETAGRFTEIRDFLRNGLQWSDADSVREEIDKWMSLRERQSDLQETRRRLALRITIAGLLAILSLPTLQREMRRPYSYLLESIGAAPLSEPGFTLLSYLLAASFLLLVVLAGVRLVTGVDFLRRMPIRR